jgi:hypothetical protein
VFVKNKNYSRSRRRFYAHKNALIVNGNCNVASVECRFTMPCKSSILSPGTHAERNGRLLIREHSLARALARTHASRFDRRPVTPASLSRWTYFQLAKEEVRFRLTSSNLSRQQVLRALLGSLVRFRRSRVFARDKLRSARLTLYLPTHPPPSYRLPTFHALASARCIFANYCPFCRVAATTRRDLWSNRDVLPRSVPHGICHRSRDCRCRHCCKDWFRARKRGSLLEV